MWGRTNFYNSTEAEMTDDLLEFLNDRLVDNFAVIKTDITKYGAYIEIIYKEPLPREDDL